CKGPRGSPLAVLSSAAFARARHWSSSNFATMALILGFTRAIWPRYARMTSRAEISRAWIRPASSRAGMKQRSLDAPVAAGEAGGDTKRSAIEVLSDSKPPMADRLPHAHLAIHQ